MPAILLLSLWLAALGGLAYVALTSMRTARIRRRLFDTPESTSPPAGTDGDTQGRLTRWLYLAGYRSSAAPTIFVLSTLFLLFLGGTAAYALLRTNILRDLMAMIQSVPGDVLDILIPFVEIAPWLLMAILAAIPWLIVRAARRRRVREIEQDLPLVLDLLSTLAEAGLSFDAALDRVMAGQPRNRPLAQEFRTFRAETLSGRSRIQSFRSLARRIDVPSFSGFISAVVQAEQIGAGVAAVLRRQADDNRSRRRERAFEMAMTLPVKRLIPLAICFLPGIMLWALGPSLFQLVEFVDAFTRNRGVR